MRQVLAPGKAMLFGEYAVLYKAPAIVAAVDRYAVARLGWLEGEPSPFVAAAVEEAHRELTMEERALPPALPIVDSSALYAEGGGGRKLGLGSSAAVVVSAYGVLVDAAGVALTPSTDLWMRCQAAHRRGQGTPGSGADVAAAIWGGVFTYLSAEVLPKVGPVTLSPEVEVTLVDTGVAASTADRLRRLRDLYDRDLSRTASTLGPLIPLATEVATEVRRGGRIPYAAVQQWNQALGPLADAIDLPIVTPALSAVDACARAVGGAAKPSGAGGGDLAVCFTPEGTAERLRSELARLGFAPLALRVGARGLHALELEEPCR